MKKFDYKLTIIIPYYNYKYFNDTLESLSLQTNRNFKVFIGDDCSPDSPDEIIEKHKNKLKVFYKRFDENFGNSDLTKHWCRCVNEIDTEWFMILGDDDMLSENAVESFYTTINNSKLNADVLRFNIQLINDKNEPQSALKVYPDLELSTELQYKRSRNEVRCSLGEYVFKKADYLKFGIQYYPLSIYSDNMMVLQYSKFGRIKNISNATAFIRITDKSLSGNPENKIEVEKAGTLFYFDMLTKYYSNFTVNHLSFFFNIVITGYQKKYINIKFTELLKLAIKRLGIMRTFRKIITIVKLKLIE